MPLADQKCIPCSGAVPALTEEQIKPLAAETPSWTVVGNHHISRLFNFPNFKNALQFVNRIGEIAEEQGHHPDIALAWGKVEATIWTHKINGLTESDFVLAAKFDRAFAQKQSVSA